jgi:hypothetical protein
MSELGTYLVVREDINPTDHFDIGTSWLLSVILQNALRL